MTVPEPVVPQRDGQALTVRTARYTWRWTPDPDRMVLTDAHGRVVVAGPVQPAVQLAGRAAAPGTVAGVEVDGACVTLTFAGVNGTGTTTLRWRFAPDSLWLDAAEYDDDQESDVDAMLSFATWVDGEAQPGLECAYLVHPGASESSALGPVIPSKIRLDATTWLGRGSNDSTDILAQQWGLPIHYFGGFTIRGSMVERHALTREVSDAFCCGLTGVPAGDLLLRHRGERVSPLLRVHSGLWGHVRTGDGAVTIGAGWVWTLGSDYPEAIRSYYRTLVAEKIVSPPERSARQREVLSAPQFNTWGAQCAAGFALTRFSQESLEAIYEDVRGSGMRPGVFVVDDKWEGEYGLLQHDPERFPAFEEFLDRVRADGMGVGLWAAFLRCDDPASHGLRTEHMLCGPDGRPVTRGNHGHEYYLFDVSQRPVREVLALRAREFVARYRPDLVKFDFGYELPALAYAAPARRDWGGELLLVKALELVIGAMREVNPDLVVMYYNLSPLLTGYVDLHSTDDMYLCADEYHLEANRRMFFSSLLGEVGTPSYGSGGYEWLRMQDIWFDSVAFGPLGSLGSFRGDARDSAPTSLDLARYNGLSAVTRPTHAFEVEPLGGLLLGGSMAGRAGSWIRREGPDRAATVVALRTTNLDGSPLEARVDGVVEADGQVVVASLAPEGIERSTRLGVVACAGERTVTVRLVSRADDGLAAVAHLHGGGTWPLDVVAADGDAVLDAVAVIDGVPVEWIEVTAA